MPMCLRTIEHAMFKFIKSIFSTHQRSNTTMNTKSQIIQAASKATYLCTPVSGLASIAASSPRKA